MLYSLNDLQREANRVYGMTAAQVLDVAQSLYEKKYITYPRTESRHLTESLAGTLEGRLKASLKVIPCTSIDIEKQLPALGKRYVDDSKVTDHHAIIPTELQLNWNLRPDEENIYELICRRFISIFLLPHKYRLMKVVTDAGELFLSKGRAVISQGWREIYNSNFSEDNIDETGLPALEEGQAVRVAETEILRKETKPPARYTDATLLSAMEHAGRFINDKEMAETLKRAGGIGTPATRAAILERLIKVGYVQRMQKSLVPILKGETLIDLVPGVLKDMETTAQWEDGLVKIEQGEVSPVEWLAGIINLTREIVSTVQAQVDVDGSSQLKPREKTGRDKPVSGKGTSKKQFPGAGSKEKNIHQCNSADGSASASTKNSRPPDSDTGCAPEHKKARLRPGTRKNLSLDRQSIDATAMRAADRINKKVERPPRTEGVLDEVFTKVFNFFKR
jgi:DNA topoisomerase-3